MMPMPNSPMGPSGPPMGGPPGAGAPMPPPGGPPGADGGGGDPEQIKGQLVMLLKKAKEVADANGVDWNEIMSAVQGNKIKSDVPLPRPPGP